MLSGLVAKQIFERARLPNEILGKIWSLADTQGRGALDVTEFVIAMHLLASYKSGAMRGVPNTLPPGLLDAAARRSRLSVVPPGRPSSSAGQPPIQPQFSGVQPGFRSASPIVNRPIAAPLGSQGTGEPWLIDATDKARFDSIFATVDTTGQGFISGEQAVQFFGNAKLPEEVLAQIWDLADINSDGVLNRDEFAVAMFLIKQRRASRDGRVPEVLPTALIPPSMRKQQQPSQPATMPAFDEAPVTKPRSNIDDLFGLDVNEQPPQQATIAPQVAQSTGGTDAGPFAAPRGALSPSTSPPPSSVFRPFVPNSSFGQGLLPQSTGLPAATQKKEASLMDDDDDSAPAKIDNDAAELGNLSNQVGNLSKSMQDLSSQRAQAEQQIAQNSQQKQAFQQRLTQLRAAYDQEVAQVKSLKDQLAASQAETKQLQQDMAMIEGTHADLTTQHQQLASALATDQQENVALKEKIRQTNAENEHLKPQLEKLKSDARQQKGLVAINKKQLATNEGERDRIRAEIAAAQHELEISQREAEETARQVEQSQRELEQAKAEPIPAPVARELSPPPPQVVSPTPSMSSNPFFRRQDSGAVFSPPMGSTIHSPAPEHEHDRNSAFDAIFGPSLGGSAPAHATSFGRDTPEAKGVVTPETPKVVEPPAPPSDSQIDSSALPIRNPLLREDSVSSSVKVAPPASRLSPAHTPRAFTPDTSTGSPVSQRADNPFALSAADEEQESVRQTLPRGETQDKMDTVPGAFPGSRSITPAQSSVNPTAVAIGAGAATLAAGAGLAAAVESQPKQTQLPEEPKDNFDDFFGGPSHKKTLSEQHADFDSAFATMDTKGTQPSNGTERLANEEFPDIQELEDDESSSDDDSEPRGFDDNFAPMSSKAAGKQPEVAPVTEGTAAPSLATPAIATNASSSSLPRINSQQSPPTYNDAVPSDNPNHFPMEYKNLLPEREDPTSPPPTAGGSNVTGPNPAGSPPAYGPETGTASRSRSGSMIKATAAPPTQAAPFDFDSAFTNLGEAPVADESDSDYDDATPGKERTHPVEFDSAFDSPAPSTRTVNSSQQPVSIYAAVTSPSGPTTNGTSISPTGPAQAGFADFNEFNSNPFPPSRSGTLQSQTTAPPSATNNNTSHDWDSLFAPLDSQPKVEREAAIAGAPLGQTAASTSVQQSTEIGSDLAAVTSHQEVRELTPPTSSTNVPQVPKSTVTPAPASNNLKVDRPQPGRALSTGTEHDDPILKRLTAMGWGRSEALAALEQFDYNIDKVS